MRHVDGEFVIIVAMDVEVSFTVFHLDGGEAGAARAQAELREFQIRVRRQADGAAVFELYFGFAIITRSQASALAHRHVEEGGLKAAPVAAIELHLAFDQTHSDDARARISKTETGQAEDRRH